MIYSSFAQLYDQLFDEQMYTDWAGFVQRQIGTQSQTILDLAGGAGRLAVILSKHGYQLTVADLSLEMLSLADQHATEEQQPINLIQANMLDLEGLEQFQVVTCFADSLCYLGNIDEIAQTIKQVRSHLEDQGCFLFDVITPYQADEVYPGYMYNFDSPEQDTAFMWQSFGDENGLHGVIHELTFFEKIADSDHYRRVAEEHYQRTYELQQYVDALHQGGFSRVKVTADFGRQPINERTTRWFFEAKP